MEDFGKIECNTCNSTKIDIIDVDEYNEILRLKCKDCGDTFMKSIDKI